MIYTIGYAPAYRHNLDVKEVVFKVGRGYKPGYPGGSVWKTAQAARAHLVEQGLDTYAVYEVDAAWEEDSEPSTQGSWHDLLRDARIIREV